MLLCVCECVAATLKLWRASPEGERKYLRGVTHTHILHHLLPQFFNTVCWSCLHPHDTVGGMTKQHEPVLKKNLGICELNHKLFGDIER